MRIVNSRFPGLASGLGIPAQQNAVVKVGIQGSYVSWVQISFDGSYMTGTAQGPQSVSAKLVLNLVLRYTDIGSAPAVVQPAGPPTSRAGGTNTA